MEILGYFAAILMGLSLGLIGGGGSILTVPIMVYLFRIDPILATGYSLFVVGLTSLVGGVSYSIKGQVDLKTGLIFAIPSFIGVYITRAYIVPRLPDPVFSVGEWTISKPLLVMAVFAILMVVASLSMIKVRELNKEIQTKKMSLANRSLLISVEGLIVGGVTGFVGAGGGFLIIPALVILVGMPMKRAVGTSLFIIAAKSLIGFIGDLQHQASINWIFLLSISAIATAGLFVGMSMSKKVSEKDLKMGFGYFVLIMGTLILFDQIQKM